MRVVVLADEEQTSELLNSRAKDSAEPTAVKTLDDFMQHESADCFIDLLFDGTKERVQFLENFSGKLIIVHSVVRTLDQINPLFIRINGWPGFLKRSIVEAATLDFNVREKVEKAFLNLGKKVQWVTDKPGFITARVIAMIINEAWFALAEDLSTPKDMDAAMRLGTNYPYGPFEWCEKIGTKNIFSLLNELAKRDARYKPAPLLEKEATGQ